MSLNFEVISCKTFKEEIIIVSSVIHTDVFMRGVLVPSGHVDFYINGGFEQPGCYDQTAMNPGSCNHERAPEYYAESIQTDRGFWGSKCGEFYVWNLSKVKVVMTELTFTAHWYLYTLGLCKEENKDTAVEMGFNASKEWVSIKNH